ncbi:helix-turn-helix domain-containing protein [Herbaspirillum seropedicae]|uniref:helix-turn-helix domain-containing protein n=1 Tax=Herbaspirillum seropedicae TaxID=964 RepID=UPI00285FB7B8|nr:helix-turn-helix transcriptional regulator [Herbaspirillum seropedicae]MDR6397891.1 transcriptional regulator with XRE-family HTH domain [Herbaspirillum seropedicae]
MRKNEGAGEVLGNVLKDFRLSQRLSQEELAFRAGVDRAFLSRVERGERSPSFDTLFSLSRALGISLTQLSQNIESRLGLLNEKDYPRQGS